MDTVPIANLPDETFLQKFETKDIAVHVEEGLPVNTVSINSPFG
jgi:hypothetical protein